MTKGELRNMIVEVLREELSTGNYLTEAMNEEVNMDRILADKLCNNPEFESACMSGDARKIMAIIDTEMQNNNLFTSGAKKLRGQVLCMTRGRDRIPVRIGEQIFNHIWYAEGAVKGVEKAISKYNYYNNY